VRIVAYALGGLFAALAGIALVAATETADASQSIPYTLPALAAVAIGGTSLLGGRGSLGGSIAGAAIIFLIQTLLDAVGVSNLWLELVYGVLLIFAIVFSSTIAAPRAALGRWRE
jgi:ribose transport system permease protein